MKTETTRKTLGTKLLELSILDDVRLTEEYWGTRLIHRSGKYWLQDWVSGFGGMHPITPRRVLVREMSILTTSSEIEEYLKPQSDLSDGDPLGYTPRDVRRVHLSVAAG